MLTLLILQIIVVIALVIVVLMQNPSVDGLAGLSNNVNNNSMSASGRTNSFLTKLTYIIAAAFIINNLYIMTVQSKKYSHHKKIIEQIVQEGEVPTND